MKTLHVNLQVANIDQSEAFYSAMFNAPPSVRKHDYAKWLLKDPSVNFSIALGKASAGIEHLGIQVESNEELQEVYGYMDKAEGEIQEEGHTVCCYSRSEKSWITDPQGVKWEVFHTYGEAEENKEESACCDETCCS